MLDQLLDHRLNIHEQRYTKIGIFRWWVINQNSGHTHGFGRLGVNRRIFYEDHFVRLHAIQSQGALISGYIGFAQEIQRPNIDHCFLKSQAELNGHHRVCWYWNWKRLAMA